MSVGDDDNDSLRSTPGIHSGPFGNYPSCISARVRSRQSSAVALAGLGMHVRVLHLLCTQGQIA